MRTAIAEDGGRYRSRSIGEVFRNTKGLDVPDALRTAAKDTVRTDYIDAKKLWKVWLEINKVEVLSYSSVLEMLKDKTYSLEAIKEIFENGNIGDMHKFGTFVSAATNNVINEDDILELIPQRASHLRSPSNLGANLPRGTLIIHGDAGHNIGSGMRGGAISVRGMVGSHLGRWMIGGSLHVEEDSGDKTGLGMGGGRIVVQGNARNEFGKEMSDGEILVFGNVGRAAGAYMSGGVIEIGGNADSDLGRRMTGGGIIVEGDVEGMAGAFMSGGRLEIAGSTGADLGFCMRGGEIRLSERDEVRSLGGMRRGGKIFVNGKEVR
jgi:formylmethanofuran dehydrogenase subunit C